jgi:YD repeat-containing protein
VLATFYTYNKAGLISIVSSPAGRKTFTQYDQLGRTLASVVGWDGSYTPFTQSSFDQTSSIKFPASGSANQTTAYTYDGSGHVVTTKAVSPSGQVSQVTQYL